MAKHTSWASRRLALLLQSTDRVVDGKFIYKDYDTGLQLDKIVNFFWRILAVIVGIRFLGYIHLKTSYQDTFKNIRIKP